MRVKTPFECPICKADCEMIYTKPSIIGHSLSQPKCKKCDSKFRMTISLKRNDIKKRVDYACEVLEIGERGEAILKAESEKALRLVEKEA